MKKEYDFSTGKRGAIDPIKPNQTKVIITLDNDIIDWFRDEVNRNNGGDYQKLINDVLKHYINEQNESLETMLRRILREELSKK